MSEISEEHKDIIDTIPEDWKDWSPWDGERIFSRLYGEDMGAWVADRVHYSELPELVRQARQLRVGDILQYIYFAAKNRKWPADFVEGAWWKPSDLTAKWGEVDLAESKEIKDGEMNVPPSLLNEMAKSLKRICSGLDNLNSKDQNKVSPIIATIFDILFLWIKTSHLERWGITQPKCWEAGAYNHSCTGSDVREFCMKLLQGIRRDQIRSIIEHYSKGAGFGSRPVGAGRFDVEPMVDEYTKNIPPDVLDGIIFTQDAMPAYFTIIKDEHGVGKREFTKDFEDRYDALMKASIHYKLKNMGEHVESPKKVRNRALDGTLCNLGTECAWTYGSYLWGTKECGCRDPRGHWHECDPEMCERGK